ncbi:hypothetical protein L248_2797 [Schleiferilactobacillus shenzhenensis LY-73]|uniref:Uncharacterized protein n=1 Tax=Schleiferilactobacillus shenzhenensis LY-73 TaxID=1231336 RepID=U4TU52_9LACO|nr:hypothetical protein L248_2797 [Schleiferilactobacillus shenzhenensis LY-73]
MRHLHRYKTHYIHLQKVSKAFCKKIPGQPQTGTPLDANVD